MARTIGDDIIAALKRGPQTTKSLALLIYKSGSEYHKMRVAQEVSMLRRFKRANIIASNTRPRVYYYGGAVTVEVAGDDDVVVVVDGVVLHLSREQANELRDKLGG